MDRAEGAPGEMPAAPATLGRRQRLTAASEVRAVWSKGRRIEAGAVAVYVRENGAAASGSRAAFSVSRKLGGAVVRNRIKRFLRESWRGRRHELGGGADVLVVARSAAARFRSLRDADAALERALRRAGLLS